MNGAKFYAIRYGGDFLKVAMRDGAFWLTTMSAYGVWTSHLKETAEIVASGKGGGEWYKPKSSFPPSTIEVVELTFKEA